MVPARPAWRVTSVLALVLCLSAQLAGSVHSASVRHVACAEHGGTVELHGGEATRPHARHAALLPLDEQVHHAHCDRCAAPTARVLPAFACTSLYVDAVPQGAVELFTAAPRL